MPTATDTIEVAITKGRCLRFRYSEGAWEVAAKSWGEYPDLDYKWRTGASTDPATAVMQAMGFEQIKPEHRELARYIVERWAL